MHKLTVILLLFCATYCCAQERFSGTIRVRKPADVTPRIAGKLGGQITPEEFCISDGIYVTAKGIKITSFEIAYGSEELFVEGNAMTEKICSEIPKLKTGERISIYSIRAKDTLAREVTLTPMLFEVVNNFDSAFNVSNPALSAEKTWGLSHLGKFFGTNYTLEDGLSRIYLVFNTDYTVWYFHHKTHPNAIKAMIDFEKARGISKHGDFEITDNKFIKINLDDTLFKFDLEGEIKKTHVTLKISTSGQEFDVIPLGDKFIW